MSGCNIKDMNGNIKSDGILDALDICHKAMTLKRSRRITSSSNDEQVLIHYWTDAFIKLSLFIHFWFEVSELDLWRRISLQNVTDSCSPCSLTYIQLLHRRNWFRIRRQLTESKTTYSCAWPLQWVSSCCYIYRHQHTCIHLTLHPASIKSRHGTHFCCICCVCFIWDGFSASICNLYFLVLVVCPWCY